MWLSIVSIHFWRETGEVCVQSSCMLRNRPPTISDKCKVQEASIKVKGLLSIDHVTALWKWLAPPIWKSSIVEA